jgi:putative methyltransferase (TIGR04325 family)
VLKGLLEATMPPVLIAAYRRLRRIVRSEPLPYEYMPRGWATDDPRLAGWNVQNVLDLQLATWPQLLRCLNGPGPLGLDYETGVVSNNDYTAHNVVMTYAYVLARAARMRQSITLLDWGGGIGHYYALSRALLPDLAIDYHCREVPLLCQGGRRVFPEAHFYETDDSALNRSYDLVLASGSLEFWPDWKTLLTRLYNHTGTYLYLTYLSLVEHAESYVIAERPYMFGSYQTAYLGWVFNRGSLLAHMDQLGAELVREFLVWDDPLVPGAPEQAKNRGFLFRRRAAENGRT